MNPHVPPFQPPRGPASLSLDQLQRVGDIDQLPLVYRLPDDFCICAAFERMAHRSGCIWLDSADAHQPASEGMQSPAARASRSDRFDSHYSFLSADPIATLIVHPHQPSPWQTLRHWEQCLPSDAIADLPPFQGGIAGLWGYESAGWLEPTLLPARENQVNDLPIAAIALGLYDWTIALDHHRDHAYLISQGFERGIVEGSVQSVTNAVSAKHASAPLANTTQARLRRARQRAETVVRWLSESVVHHPGNPAPRPFRLSGQHPTAIDERLQSNFTSPAYRDAIDTVVGSIHQGETFQVNLAQRLVCDARIPSQDLYLRLRQTNPAPMAGYLNVGPFAVVSSSPEGFLTVRDRIVETRPIKGTVPRVGDAEIDAAAARDLQSNEKERAENIMIVDLMRNDLSRVCDDQTLKVTQLCQVQQFRHVQHLVSVITGRLQEDCNITDLIAACFPGGSITGAPKIAAMQRISTQETHPRGAYCGSMGYISCGGAADLNILIRTITAAHGWWQIPVGGGITAASNPQAEEQETWHKANGMLQAILTAQR